MDINKRELDNYITGHYGEDEFRDDDDFPTCPICGCALEWEDCWNGCYDGYFDGHDEDPLWYDRGHLILCSACGGKGGFQVCPNAERHPRAEAAQTGA